MTKFDKIARVVAGLVLASMALIIAQQKQVITVDGLTAGGQQWHDVCDVIGARQGWLAYLTCKIDQYLSGSGTQYQCNGACNTPVPGSSGKRPDPSDPMSTDENSCYYNPEFCN